MLGTRHRLSLGIPLCLAVLAMACSDDSSDRSNERRPEASEPPTSTSEAPTTTTVPMRTIRLEVAIEDTEERPLGDPCGIPQHPDRNLGRSVTARLADDTGRLLDDAELPHDGEVQAADDWGLDQYADLGGHTFCVFTVNFGRHEELAAYVITTDGSSEPTVVTLDEARAQGWIFGLTLIYSDEEIDFYGD